MGCALSLINLANNIFDKYPDYIHQHYKVFNKFANFISKYQDHETVSNLISTFVPKMNSIILRLTDKSSDDDDEVTLIHSSYR